MTVVEQRCEVREQHEETCSEFARSAGLLCAAALARSCGV